MQALPSRSSAWSLLPATKWVEAPVQLGASNPTFMARQQASIVKKYGPAGVQENGCWILEADLSRHEFLDLPFAISIARCRRLELRFAAQEQHRISPSDSHVLNAFFSQLSQALIANTHVRELHFQFRGPVMVFPEAMLTVIREKRTLHAVGIDKFFLPSDSRSAVMAAIAENRSIKTLQIDASIAYGESCSMWLGEMLKAAPSIRTLQLTRRHAVQLRRQVEEDQGSDQQRGFHFLSLAEAHRLRHLELRFAHFHDGELDELFALCLKNSALISVAGVGGGSGSGTGTSTGTGNRRPHLAVANLRYLRQALARNYQLLVQQGAAALDLLLDHLPADSVLPDLPWDIRTTMSNSFPPDVLAQLALGLESGFAVSDPRGFSS